MYLELLFFYCYLPLNIKPKRKSQIRFFNNYFSIRTNSNPFIFIFSSVRWIGFPIKLGCLHSQFTYVWVAGWFFSRSLNQPQNTFRLCGFFLQWHRSSIVESISVRRLCLGFMLFMVIWYVEWAQTVILADTQHRQPLFFVFFICSLFFQTQFNGIPKWHGSVPKKNVDDEDKGGGSGGSGSNDWMKLDKTPTQNVEPFQSSLANIKNLYSVFIILQRI